MGTDSAQRARDVLLAVLAVTTGVTDATAFERLGHVFASVITGNLIVVGVAAVRGDGTLARFAGCAVAGYILGVLIATPWGGPDKRVWPAAATLVLGLELVVLIGFGVGWEIVAPRPGATLQLVLVVTAAVAMGAQSSAVRRLGGMSTTYLTSTLTGLVESVARRRWSRDEARSLGILLAAFGGAAAGTALILDAPRWLPALQLAPLAIVIAGAVRLTAREGPRAA